MRAALCCALQIQDDQARIIDPAVGVHEALADRRRKRCAIGRRTQIHALRSGQRRAQVEIVVEHQPESDHPCRSQVRHMRQHEAQRPRDMRRDPQQRFALVQRIAHETNIAVLEIAQAAVNQLAAGR